MKKNNFEPFHWGRVLIKYIIMMKVAWVLMIASVLQVTAGNTLSYSQNSKLSPKLEDVTLEELIWAIKKETGFNFFYSSGDIASVKHLSIDIKDATAEEILEQALEGTGLVFEIIHKTVIIKKSKTPILEPIEKPVEQQPQTREVRGLVRDDRGSMLPGVSVVVKGTLIGTSTANDGTFRLECPVASEILVFSFIGMKSQEINITGKSHVEVTLVSETVGVDEVVVVGYGTQKKESVVGAITQVNNETLVKSGNQTITNAIAGKLSGVLTIQQTGEPGADQSEIIIRGLSSWNGSEPLVLVDGVERDFKDLDPNEVNTISVLKDASATAVFGAKGANGVIIVTTKRGIPSKPKLSMTASYGMEKATRIPDHIDSYTTLQLLNVGTMNSGLFSELIPQNALNEYKLPSSRLNSLRYPNVNWFDVISKPFAPTANANVNIQGGTSFIKYFCSLGYLYQGSYFNQYTDGEYLDTRYWYKRFNYRGNIDFALTKSTNLSFNIGGDVDVKNEQRITPWRYLYSTSPARYPAYFPEWVLEEVPDPDYPDDVGKRLVLNFGEFSPNPYTQMNNGQFNRYTGSKLFTDLILDQKLDFITQGLSVTGKVSLSTYFNSRTLYSTYQFPEYQLNYEDIGKPGVNPWYRNNQSNEVFSMEPLALKIGGLSDNYYRDLYYEFALNYARSFGLHSVTGLALMNRQQKNIGTQFPFYNEALVSRATYDYAHKYLMEINVSYTGSERFAPSNRFGLFPSGAVGWTISEEKFFKNAFPWVNKLKIRYSDGLTGSDYATNRWLYVSEYVRDLNGHITEDLLPNTGAQWEEARKRDIGLELGIFNSFSLTLDLFDEQREKMLLTPQNVTMLVASSFKELNLGKLKKHGIEIEAEYNKTNKNGLNYFVRGILGLNENRIIYKDDLIYAPDYTKAEGKPLGAQLEGIQLTGSGYYTSVNDIHNNVAPVSIGNINVGDYLFLDYNGDGTISVLDKHPIEGSMYPPVSYSLSSGFRYKGFDFSFMFQGNAGKYVEFNMQYETEFLQGNWRVHKSQLDYWTPTNPDATHATINWSGNGADPMLAWGGTAQLQGYATFIEDRYWRNADYLRLKEVYMGYTFDSRWLEQMMGVSNIHLYVTGNNLLTLTSLIEGDPERKDFYAGFYPQMSSVKIGMKLNF